MRDPRSVLITGASSGIGRALAMRYSQPGRSLALSGRDQKRLDETAALCTELGTTVRRTIVDVTDADAMRSWIAQSDELAPLDLVIANAGVSAGTGAGGEDADQARHIFRTNLDGVVNTIHPAIDCMKPRDRGQIAIISSLAAYRGFPGAPAYCASKAAVRTYGQALRGALHRHGIGVTVVCPGFVRSAMTDTNDYAMPLMMEAARAADIIVRGIEKNRANVAFPWLLHGAVWLFAALPAAWTDPLFRRLPEKS
ncbi:MAG: SDR family NAD(P)-dependent oxidoreductase [Alphaproteobacteria bacterium]|nr:SDR family NAD(P)-dependent oxidoreductase [Alphaproteobacteria bacterium]